LVTGDPELRPLVGKYDLKVAVAAAATSIVDAER
jgi:hypothetical protein